MKPIPLLRVIIAVSEHLNIEPAVMRHGYSRHPNLTRYRKLVAVCAKRLTIAGFEDIAEAVTGTRKRHSTYSSAYHRGLADPAIVKAADQIAARLLAPR